MKNNAINANQLTPLTPLSGGSGLSSYTINNLIASGTTSTGNYQQISNGATGTLLQSSGASTLPFYTTAVYPSTATANGILYASSTNVYSQLTMSANGVLITSATSVPLISSTLPSAVQLNITSTGTITTGAWNGSTINVQFGGTGLSSFTPNNMLFSGTTSTGNFQTLAGGASGTLLQSSGATTLPAYTSATYPSTTTINRILYSSSANTVSEIPTTNNGVLITDSLGAPLISTSLPVLFNSENVSILTADYTVLNTDNGKTFCYFGTTSIVITIPNQTTTTLTQGYNFNVINYGTGDIRIERMNSDILLNANQIIGQGDEAKVILITAGTPNTYIVTGGTQILPVTYNWYLPTGSNASFIVCGLIPCQTTFTQAYFRSNAGTITGQLTINGTNIVGALSISTTQNYSSLTSPNIAYTGGILGITTSANAASSNIHVAITGYQRTYLS